MPDPMMAMWAQYTHLDKLYGYLPGLTDAIPAIFGMDPDSYATLRAEFDDRAQGAARDCSTTPTSPPWLTPHRCSPVRPRWPSVTASPTTCSPGSRSCVTCWTCADPSIRCVS